MPDEIIDPTPDPTPDPELKKLADLIKDNPIYQDELNNMMASNRKKLTQQNTELVTQLNQIKQKANLTQEERDELQSRITQLEEQYMTKEELAKRESQKQQKDFESQLIKSSEESKKWQQMYTNATIERSLLDAASEGEALHPSQLVELLRGKTQLIEIIDNGQPTGNYQPIIKFNDTNEEGQNVILDLSPTDVIKRMKELPDNYGNLFKGTAVGGLGETGNQSGDLRNQPSFKDLMSDPEKYAKWRKENPNLDVSKLRRK
jgi:hypothetical protein